MQWATEHNDEVIDLIEKGLEYKSIAEKTGRSIGSICAKAKRLRDAGRLKVERYVVRNTAAKALPSPARFLGMRSPKCKMNPDPEAVALLRLLEEEARTAKGLLSLDEREACEERREPKCKYPVGDPTKTRDIYCAGDRLLGSPYCAVHHKRCFGVETMPVRMKGKVRERELETA